MSCFKSIGTMTNKTLLGCLVNCWMTWLRCGWRCFPEARKVTRLACQSLSFASKLTLKVSFSRAWEESLATLFGQAPFQVAVTNRFAYAKQPCSHLTLYTHPTRPMDNLKEASEFYNSHLTNAQPGLTNNSISATVNNPYDRVEVILPGMLRFGNVGLSFLFCSRPRVEPNASSFRVDVELPTLQRLQNRPLESASSFGSTRRLSLYHRRNFGSPTWATLLLNGTTLRVVVLLAFQACKWTAFFGSSGRFNCLASGVLNPFDL